jgi:hypothetical protein
MRAGRPDMLYAKKQSRPRVLMSDEWRNSLRACPNPIVENM